jgi:hypothetical protein
MLVFEIQDPQFADLQFRGILGENLLGQLDILIDNDCNLLCLDD